MPTETTREQTSQDDDGGWWEGDFYVVPSDFEKRRAKWIANTRAALRRLMDKWGMKEASHDR